MTPADPISAQLDNEARAVVAQLAMLDARDLANRAIAHANELRALGGEHAERAAGVFDRQAAEMRRIERGFAKVADALAE